MNARTATRHRAARPARARRRSGESPVRRLTASVAGPVLWALVVVLAIVVPAVLPSLMSGAPSKPGAATSVRVGAADTLWSIASANRAPGRSTAETVDEIRRMNGLTDSGLSAGVVLRVPAREPADTAFAAAGGGETAP